MNTKSALPYMLAGAAGALVASVTPLLISKSQAETKLLPFQGRLTDAAGTAIADGAKVVEFKMYDAPTGGNVKWAGEVHKLSVNGGLVNTMLGSKASLGSVDFSTHTYLQITVDANNDGQITAADPPLLPRQSVVPAVYAVVSGQMQYVVPAGGGNPASVAASGWEAVFDNGRPDTGRISGAKLANKTVTAAQIKDDSVGSAVILDGTISSADLSPALAAQLDQAAPPGTIIAYGGSLEFAPQGWLHCDGTAVSRAKYSRLFSKIGTAWGTGDGTSTFHLPNLQGMFLRGVDGPRDLDPDKASRNPNNGGNDGNMVGSWQPDELKSHSHSWTLGAASNPTAGDNSLINGYGFTRFINFGGNATGGSETRPKNSYVYYLIKY